MGNRCAPLAAVLVAFLGLLVSPLAAQAAPAKSPESSPQGSPERSTIVLNSGVVDLRSPLAAVAEPMRLSAGAPGSDYVLVKFAGPVSAEQLDTLHAVAGRVYTYLPHDAFLVRLRAGDALDRLAGVGAWVGPYHPAYKISRFAAAVEPAAVDAGKAARRRIVMLHVYPDADLVSVLDEIKARGIEGVVGANPGAFFSRVRLLLTEAQIASWRDGLALIPEVFWVEVEGRRVLYNDTTVWVGQSGLAGGQTTPIFARGIHGEGQVVGVLDTGIDPDMCYFRDTARGLPPRNECNGGTVVDELQRKTLAVDFLWSSECSGGITGTEWDTQGHGTHVAGTIAGDNFANPIARDAGDGMAPGAKLVVQDCGYQVNACADCPGIGCPVVDLNPIFQQTYSQGARLHSNSWGDQEDASPQNNYTSGSQDVDEFMWSHKDFLIFFAAGNSGPGTASVGSPSTAKSAMSVGATLRGSSANSMASFSSCGPTDDGRIKPEITVPGSSIVSAAKDNSVTTNNCGTTSMSGTSMATPGAAGLAALARQYYTDGFYPSGVATAANAFTPSAALVRATLVNSAASMANAGAIPGNCQGWGRVLLDDTLSFSGDTRKVWIQDDAAAFPSGSANEERSYTFTVAAGQSLKATLAWTDFPSTPAATIHLVNDLDLVVTGPGGTYRGNVFASGQSTTGGNADRRNTLEQVLLSSPAAGTYTVVVRSFTVPQGPQPFALVVTGAVTTGSCTPPAVPTGVSASATSQTAANVTWAAVAGATSYTVSRSTTSGGPYAQVGTSTTTSFANSGLSCNTTYYYVVSASNGTCGSASSAQAQTTTQACTGNVLANGVPVTNVSGAAASQQFWTMAVPAGASGLKFVTSGGTGDADLYVKLGSAPTTSVYDCRSIGSTTAETCNIATAQAGTYHVLVHGYSAFSGLSLTGSYSTPGPELLTNGGFETTLSPWVPSGSAFHQPNGGSTAHGGTGFAYLGNADNTSGAVYQQIAIPAGAAPTFSFWLNVTSSETTTTTQYDKLFVEVRNSAGTLLSTLATYSNLNKGTAGVYSQKSFSLAAWAGQTVRLQFRGTTDTSLITTFRVDDASAK